MRLKRFVAVFLVLIMAMAFLGGCNKKSVKVSSGGSGSDSSTTESSNDTSESGVSSLGSAVSGTSSISGSSSKVTSGKSSTTSTGVTPAVTPGGNTGAERTLTVWGPDSNASLLAAETAFQKANSKIKIKNVNHAAATLTELKLALSSNQAPDILIMDQTYLGAAGTEGYLKDLNQYGAQNYKSKFVTSTWESAQMYGKQWGMPFDANTIAQVCNMDMLNAANASVPTTYQELRTACDKVKAKYPNAFGYTQAFNNGEPGGKNWVAFSFFNWLWRMGGEILSSDYKTATFNSQMGVDALQMLVDMKTAKQASPTYLHNEFFAGGNVAAITNIGSWTYNSIFGANKKANFNVSLLPVLKTGVKPYSGLGLYCYAISSSSKNPQDAFEFIKYYTTNKSYQLQYCKANYLIPSLLEAHSDSFYSKTEWQVMIEQLKYSKYRPSVQGWDQIESNLADAIQSAIAGSRTPKAALDTSAKYANSILARYVK